GQYDEAWRLVEHHLQYENPNSCAALTIALACFRYWNRPATAYQFAKRVTEIDPSKAVGWWNLAASAEQLYRFEEAEQYFRKAEARSQDDPQKAGLYLNWASCKVAQGDWPVAEKMARKALHYNPESKKAQLNLGLALLAQKKYREGWPMY